MTRLASPRFWTCFDELPPPGQELARKNFALLKEDLRHPSLPFKKVGKYRSVRVGRHHRGLGAEVAGGILWFWIGSHTEYDKLLG